MANSLACWACWSGPAMSDGVGLAAMSGGLKPASAAASGPGRGDASGLGWRWRLACFHAPLMGGPPPCARFDHASITVARRGTAPDVARRLEHIGLVEANASPTPRQLRGARWAETGEGVRPRRAPGGGRAA